MDYALNRDRMRLKELSPIASFLLLVVVPIFALAAPREKAMAPSVRPLAVVAETKAEMARYSLKAYENRDQTNAVKGLLFTPKPVGLNALPMIVYIPGNGEIGNVARQFRQRAIFDRVTSAEFQEKYPCFLLALTPPASATTILGGMPGHPTGLQKALRDFVLDICRMQAKPKVDLNRLYVTGFSYGGMGAYALAQHFPGTFAASVPIAALPPLPEYFDKGRPGNWWHFHNMTFMRNEVLATIVPTALLLLAIPLACAFHTSPHAQWMMDNTIPRLLWYISAVPLAVLVQKMGWRNGMIASHCSGYYEGWRVYHAKLTTLVR